MAWRATLRPRTDLEMDPGLRRDDIVVGPPSFHNVVSFDYPLDPRQRFMVYPRHWNGFGPPARRDGRIAQRESTTLTS